MEAVQKVARSVWTGRGFDRGTRPIAEEAAVAFTYDGSTYAVMMATPRDLHDFAVGFSLTESVVSHPAEIESFEAIEEGQGIELRMRLAGIPSRALAERRRYLAGPVGCGLCGIDSLAEAMRPVAGVGPGVAVRPAAILSALDAVAAAQALNRETHAVHAAGFCRPDGAVVAVREDVGRHNALDKLAGALARTAVDATSGFVVVTSRLSVELVQKTAAIGAPVMVAVSAPTALAVRAAQSARMTLIAVARRDGFEVYTHPERIAADGSS